MLQYSMAPHFEKTMTGVMLRRSESVVSYSNALLRNTRTHGDLFHTPELSLKGPNGHSMPVMLKVRAHDRVYLGHGWTEFVKVNGLQVGDRMVFFIVQKSTFRVFLCSQLEEKAILSKDEDESGRDNNRTIENVVPSVAPLYSKAYHRRVKQETAVHKCGTSFNPAETPVQQWHCGSPDKEKVASVKKMSPTLEEEDFIKHPGLASAVTLRSRSPHFFKKLTKISLECSNDIHLELPLAFVKEHGHKFQARVFLLGPCGGLRIVSLRISSSGRRGGSRVQIRRGWRDFALENGFQEGDVLLFSLVGLSKFVVQWFPSV